MTNAILNKEEATVMNEAKRAYNKSETRRFALIFPLDLPGYVNVQYSKDCLSPYNTKKMNHPYQLGLGETFSICRFLMLHELDVIKSEFPENDRDECRDVNIMVSEKDKGTMTVSEFMASLEK